LDFLGFIRPNRDFSKGYEQKNKKNRLASQVVCKTSQTPSNLILCSVAARFNPAIRKIMAQILLIVKKMSALIALAVGLTSWALYRAALSADEGVMAGLVPAIHAFDALKNAAKLRGQKP
jgi:hypothetical protein